MKTPYPKQLACINELVTMLRPPASGALNGSETGTGKTYCYIKTIFELNKLYGWSKFIIVVPSVAIREGVLKNIENLKRFNMPFAGTGHNLAEARGPVYVETPKGRVALLSATTSGPPPGRGARGRRHVDQPHSGPCHGIAV